MTVGVNSNFDLYDLAEFRFGIEILHSVVWDRNFTLGGLGSKFYTRWFGIEKLQ